MGGQVSIVFSDLRFSILDLPDDGADRYYTFDVRDKNGHFVFHQQPHEGIRCLATQTGEVVAQRGRFGLIKDSDNGPPKIVLHARDPAPPHAILWTAEETSNNFADCIAQLHPQAKSPRTELFVKLKIKKHAHHKEHFTVHVIILRKDLEAWNLLDELGRLSFNFINDYLTTRELDTLTCSDVSAVIAEAFDPERSFEHLTSICLALDEIASCWDRVWKLLFEKRHVAAFTSWPDYIASVSSAVSSHIAHIVDTVDSKNAPRLECLKNMIPLLFHHHQKTQLQDAFTSLAKGRFTTLFLEGSKFAALSADEQENFVNRKHSFENVIPLAAALELDAGEFRSLVKTIAQLHQAMLMVGALRRIGIQPLNADLDAADAGAGLATEEAVAAVFKASFARLIDSLSTVDGLVHSSPLIVGITASWTSALSTIAEGWPHINFPSFASSCGASVSTTLRGGIESWAHSTDPDLVRLHQLCQVLTSMAKSAASGASIASIFHTDELSQLLLAKLTLTVRSACSDSTSSGSFSKVAPIFFSAVIAVVVGEIPLNALRDEYFAYAKERKIGALDTTSCTLVSVEKCCEILKALDAACGGAANPSVEESLSQCRKLLAEKIGEVLCSGHQQIDRVREFAASEIIASFLNTTAAELARAHVEPLLLALEARQLCSKLESADVPELTSAVSEAVERFTSTKDVVAAVNDIFARLIANFATIDGQDVVQVAKKWVAVDRLLPGPDALHPPISALLNAAVAAVHQAFVVSLPAESASTASCENAAAHVLALARLTQQHSFKGFDANAAGRCQQDLAAKLGDFFSSHVEKLTAFARKAKHTAGDANSYESGLAELTTFASSSYVSQAIQLSEQILQQRLAAVGVVHQVYRKIDQLTDIGIASLNANLNHATALSTAEELDQTVNRAFGNAVAAAKAKDESGEVFGDIDGTVTKWIAALSLLSGRDAASEVGALVTAMLQGTRTFETSVVDPFDVPLAHIEGLIRRLGALSSARAATKAPQEAHDACAEELKSRLLAAISETSVSLRARASASGDLGKKRPLVALVSSKQVSAFLGLSTDSLHSSYIQPIETCVAAASVIADLRELNVEPLNEALTARNPDTIELVVKAASDVLQTTIAASFIPVAEGAAPPPVKLSATLNQWTGVASKLPGDSLLKSFQKLAATAASSVAASVEALGQSSFSAIPLSTLEVVCSNTQDLVQAAEVFPFAFTETRAADVLASLGAKLQASTTELASELVRLSDPAQFNSLDDGRKANFVSQLSFLHSLVKCRHVRLALRAEEQPLFSELVAPSIAKLMNASVDLRVNPTLPMRIEKHLARLSVLYSAKIPALTQACDADRANLSTSISDLVENARLSTLNRVNATAVNRQRRLSSKARPAMFARAVTEPPVDVDAQSSPNPNLAEEPQGPAIDWAVLEALFGAGRLLDIDVCRDLVAELLENIPKKLRPLFGMFETDLKAGNYESAKRYRALAASLHDQEVPIFAGLEKQRDALTTYVTHQRSLLYLQVVAAMKSAADPVRNIDLDATTSADWILSVKTFFLAYNSLTDELKDSDGEFHVINRDIKANVKRWASQLEKRSEAAAAAAGGNLESDELVAEYVAVTFSLALPWQDSTLSADFPSSFNFKKQFAIFVQRVTAHAEQSIARTNTVACKCALATCRKIQNQLNIYEKACLDDAVKTALDGVLAKLDAFLPDQLQQTMKRAGELLEHHRYAEVVAIAKSLDQDQEPAKASELRRQVEQAAANIVLAASNALMSNHTSDCWKLQPRCESIYAALQATEAASRIGLPKLADELRSKATALTNETLQFLAGEQNASAEEESERAELLAIAGELKAMVTFGAAIGSSIDAAIQQEFESATATIVGTARDIASAATSFSAHSAAAQNAHKLITKLKVQTDSVWGTILKAEIAARIRKAVLDIFLQSVGAADGALQTSLDSGLLTIESAKDAWLRIHLLAEQLAQSQATQPLLTQLTQKVDAERQGALEAALADLRLGKLVTAEQRWNRFLASVTDVPPEATARRQAAVSFFWDTLKTEVESAAASIRSCSSSGLAELASRFEELTTVSGTCCRVFLLPASSTSAVEDILAKIADARRALSDALQDTVMSTAWLESQLNLRKYDAVAAAAGVLTDVQQLCRVQIEQAKQQQRHKVIAKHIQDTVNRLVLVSYAEFERDFAASIEAQRLLCVSAVLNTELPVVDVLIRSAIDKIDESICKVAIPAFAAFPQVDAGLGAVARTWGWRIQLQTGSDAVQLSLRAAKFISAQRQERLLERLADTVSATCAARSSTEDDAAFVERFGCAGELSGVLGAFTSSRDQDVQIIAVKCNELVAQLNQFVDQNTPLAASVSTTLRGGIESWAHSTDPDLVRLHQLCQVLTSMAKSAASGASIASIFHTDELSQLLLAKLTLTVRSACSDSTSSGSFSKVAPIFFSAVIAVVVGEIPLNALRDEYFAYAKERKIGALDTTSCTLVSVEKCCEILKALDAACGGAANPSVEESLSQCRKLLAEKIGEVLCSGHQQIDRVREFAASEIIASFLNTTAAELARAHVEPLLLALEARQLCSKLESADVPELTSAVSEAVERFTSTKDVVAAVNDIFARLIANFATIDGQDVVQVAKKWVAVDRLLPGPDALHPPISALLNAAVAAVHQAFVVSLPAESASTASCENAAAHVLALARLTQQHSFKGFDANAAGRCQQDLAAKLGDFFSSHVEKLTAFARKAKHTAGDANSYESGLAELTTFASSSYVSQAIQLSEQILQQRLAAVGVVHQVYRKIDQLTDIGIASLNANLNHATALSTAEELDQTVNRAFGNAVAAAKAKDESGEVFGDIDGTVTKWIAALSLLSGRDAASEVGALVTAMLQGTRTFETSVVDPFDVPLAHIEGLIRRLGALSSARAATKAPQEAHDACAEELKSRLLAAISETSVSLRARASASGDLGKKRPLVALVSSKQVSAFLGLSTDSLHSSYIQPIETCVAAASVIADLRELNVEPLNEALTARNPDTIELVVKAASDVLQTTIAASFIPVAEGAAPPPVKLSATLNQWTGVASKLPGDSLLKSFQKLAATAASSVAASVEALGQSSFSAIPLSTLEVVCSNTQDLVQAAEVFPFAFTETRAADVLASLGAKLQASTTELASELVRLSDPAQFNSLDDGRKANFVSQLSFLHSLVKCRHVRLALRAEEQPLFSELVAPSIAKLMNASVDLRVNPTLPMRIEKHLARLSVLYSAKIPALTQACDADRANLSTSISDLVENARLSTLNRVNATAVNRQRRLSSKARPAMFARAVTEPPVDVDAQSSPNPNLAEEPQGPAIDWAVLEALFGAGRLLDIDVCRDLVAELLENIPKKLRPLFGMFETDLKAGNYESAKRYRALAASLHDQEVPIFAGLEKQRDALTTYVTHQRSLLYLQVVAAMKSAADPVRNIDLDATTSADWILSVKTFFLAYNSLTDELKDSDGEFHVINRDIKANVKRWASQLEKRSEAAAAAAGGNLESDELVAEYVAVTFSLALPWQDSTLSADFPSSFNFKKQFAIFVQRVTAHAEQSIARTNTVACKCALATCRKIQNQLNIYEKACLDDAVKTALDGVLAKLDAFLPDQLQQTMKRAGELLEHHRYAEVVAIAKSLDQDQEPAKASELRRQVEQAAANIVLAASNALMSNHTSDCWKLQPRCESIYAALQATEAASRIGLPKLADELRSKATALTNETLQFLAGEQNASAEEESERAELLAIAGELKAMVTFGAAIGSSIDAAIQQEFESATATIVGTARDIASAATSFSAHSAAAQNAHKLITKLKVQTDSVWGTILKAEIAARIRKAVLDIFLQSVGAADGALQTSLDSGLLTIESAKDAWLRIHLLAEQLAQSQATQPLLTQLTQKVDAERQGALEAALADLRLGKLVTAEQRWNRFLASVTDVPPEATARRQAAVSFFWDTLKTEVESAAASIRSCSSSGLAELASRFEELTTVSGTCCRVFLLPASSTSAVEDILAKIADARRALSDALQDTVMSTAWLESQLNLRKYDAVAAAAGVLTDVQQLCRVQIEQAKQQQRHKVIAKHIQDTVNRLVLVSYAEFERDFAASIEAQRLLCVSAVLNTELPVVDVLIRSAIDKIDESICKVAIPAFAAFPQVDAGLGAVARTWGWRIQLQTGSDAVQLSLRAAKFISAQRQERLLERLADTVSATCAARSSTEDDAAFVERFGCAGELSGVLGAFTSSRDQDVQIIAVKCNELVAQLNQFVDQNVRVLGSAATSIASQLEKSIQRGDPSSDLVSKIRRFRGVPNDVFGKEGKSRVEAQISAFAQGIVDQHTKAAQRIRVGQARTIAFDSLNELHHRLRELSDEEAAILLTQANTTGAQLAEMVQSAVEEFYASQSVSTWLSNENFSSLVDCFDTCKLLSDSLAQQGWFSVQPRNPFGQVELENLLAGLSSAAHSALAAATADKFAEPAVTVPFQKPASALRTIQHLLSEKGVRCQSAAAAAASSVTSAFSPINGFLQELEEKARVAADPSEVAQVLVDVRRPAMDAPILFSVIKPVMTRILEAFVKRVDANGLLLLSQFLFKDQLGSIIFAEFPKIFSSASSLMFPSRAGELSPEECVKRLDCQPPLPAADANTLKDLLVRHNSLSQSLCEGYFKLGKDWGDARNEAKAGLQTAVASANKLMLPAGAARTQQLNQAIAEIVCHLSVLFTMHVMGESIEEAVRNNKPMIKPHTAQIITVFRLLGLDSTAQAAAPVDDGLDDWIEIDRDEQQNVISRSLMRETSTKSKGLGISNHMVQVLTGEGKSITLGLLGACCCLLGIDADIVCYSEYLSERDKEKMSPYYEFIGLAQDQVRYFTFDGLCSERMKGVGELATHVLNTGTPLPGASRSRLCGEQRVLLIDEVDVFFSKRFYGETYNAGVTLRGPEITSLVRVIYEKRGTSFLPHSSPELADVLKRYHPKLAGLLKALAGRLAQNANNFSIRKYKLDEERKLVAYKYGDSYDTSIVFPNETLFAYLALVGEGKLTPEQAEPHIGIDCFLGQFSYAEIPSKEYYCHILGVTGTLKTQPTPSDSGHMILSASDQAVLKNDFQVARYTFAPSVFGTPKLNGSKGFSYVNDVRMHFNDANWAAQIEQFAFEVKKNGGSCLIFFKNIPRMQQFLAARPLMKEALVLTSETPPDQREALVRASTQGGKIMLLTRAFGRGVDFIPMNNVMLNVLQTFYSSSESELVQIKGRTARQGQNGTFSMDLCATHLEDKFFVAELRNAASPEAATAAVAKLVQQAVDTGKLRELLEARRTIKMTSKTADRATRKDRAKQLDKASRKIVDTLVEGASIEKQLDALVSASLASVITPTLYTAILDVSGSMTGEPWEALRSAFNVLVTELLQVPAIDQSKLSVIFFSNEAEEKYFGPVSKFQLPDKCPGGHTNYEAAYSSLLNSYKKHKEAVNLKKVVVFVTDGAPDRGKHLPKIAELMKTYASQLSKYYCIFFNKWGQVPHAVTEMAHEAQQYKVPTELLHTKDSASLVDSMKAAVHSAPMHRQ